jgi:hypothetical protein
MAQIKRSESLSRLLISVVHHRFDSWGRWLQPGAARARAHGGTSRLSAVARRSSGFLKPRWSFSEWALLLRDHSDEGNLIMLTLIGRGRQRNPATVRQLGRCLMTVRAASGEASAPRTCAEASSSSLLASRPMNCSEQRQKTQIWWLPRVRRVLDLRQKICTIGGAIYRGF